MTYNVYQGNDLIATTEEKSHEVEGLTPNTEYTFSVTEVKGDKESDKATVTVKTKAVNVTGVTLSPKTKTADSGTAGSEQLTVTVAPSNASNKAVTYTVAPETTGLTVSNSGEIKWTDAVASGTYTTTVNTEDGNKADTHVLTLKDPVVAVTGVTVAPKTNNLEVDGTRQLNVTIDPSNATNQDVSYASSDDGVATVNNDGLVTAIAEGEVTITVTVDGKSDTATINVTDPEPEPEPEE